MRRINYAWTIVSMVGLSPPAWAGPYSSGLNNNNPGAVDPGVAGVVGSTVNPAFVGWATGFSSYLPAPGVDPGWDSPLAALGPVSGDNFDIVSLGDLSAEQIAAGTPPGKITLSFSGGIRNSGGADFAVFENALGTQSSVFAELAHVEVSSDGLNFARFPTISLTPAAVGPYGSIDPTAVHNLPGKHVNAYGDSWGTPFDLSDLAGDPLVQSGAVNLNGLRFIRLIDIPGNGSFLDSGNRPIFDAWPTFGSGGFDLEAVGVLHAWKGGDANFDGIVDDDDLGILAANWQQSLRTFEQGDFDQSGTVDIKDLRILATNWPGDASALCAVALPEPSAAAAVGLLGLLVSGVRKRSKETKMLRLIAAILFTTICGTAMAGPADFEDLGLGTNSFHDNTPFVSGGAHFNNNFTDFGGGFTAWEGFAYSTKTDTTTPGFANQYSAIPGKGAGNSNTYGVGFVGNPTRPIITLPAGTQPTSMDITNTTYGYLSMRDGDPFAKKFGGASGNDPDFFLLTITGKTAADAVVGQVNFYLSDFRFANNAQDFIRSTWTTVDLSPLSGAAKLSFELSSTDNGSFGMNTPAYFALDDLVFVPEPGALLLAALPLIALRARRNRAC